MEEIWKDVIGYEGLFKVSNFGNGKALRVEIPMQNGWYMVKPARDLKPKLSDYGYHFFALCTKRKQKSWPVHRLVAIHFIPNPENKPQVNHISNLEWVTAQENIDHAERTGLRDNNGFRNAMYGKFGKDHPAYGNKPPSGENSPMFGKKGKMHPAYGKKATGEKNWKSKLVLDTQTGVFYDTIIEAANAKSINKNTLYWQLQGRSPNKTSLIYA